MSLTDNGFTAASYEYPDRKVHIDIAEFVENISVDNLPNFKSLTPMQQQFLLNYLNGQTRFNATQAYIEAGYEGKNPKVYGCLELKRPKVQLALRELMEQFGLTVDWVKCQLGEIASGMDMADLEPYLEGEKSLDDLRNEGVNTRLVSKARCTVEKDGSRHYSVEVMDRMAALKEITRVLSMVSDKSEITINGGLDLKNMPADELKRLEAALAKGREDA